MARMFLLVILAALFLVAAPRAQAQLDEGFDFARDLAESAGLATEEPRTFISDAINLILGLVAIIALAVLIFGGFQYITSAGDDQKAESAKKTILYAVVGLIIIGLAAAIINFVINAFTS